MNYDSHVPPAQFEARLVANEDLGGGYRRLRFVARSAPSPLRDVTPGQFVMLRGAWGRELLNPRAFSVLTVAGDQFEVLLKAYGQGTTRLAALRPDEGVTVTGPLGRGFAPPQPGRAQWLVAGGVGLPPLYLQAERAVAAGLASSMTLFYGGRDASDLVLLDAFERFGVQQVLATEDGSIGMRGYVTAPLEAALRQHDTSTIELLACGPTPMLHAVRRIGLQHGVQTWLCLEEEMACGFGVCLGCAVPVYGERPFRYCCTDGPVFDAKDVRWS